jgi:hypothetical protein
MKRISLLSIFLAGTAALPCGCGNGSGPGHRAPDGGDSQYEEQREPCSVHNPLKNVFFGDLHVHTSLSFDAWIWDGRSTPEDAYRFAKGETIPLQPTGGNEGGRGEIRLERPLDFAAVVDHGELLAEVEACVTTDSGVYDSLTCRLFRRGDFLSTIVVTQPLAFPKPRRSKEICGSGKVDCPLLAHEVWGRLVEAAEEAYDRTSECTFTSFPGYEYTGTPAVSNRHRVVLFRNGTVPDRPVTYFEAPTPQELWRQLKQACLDGMRGCDVMSVPHNSNLSNGGAFHVDYAGAQDPAEQQKLASLRAEIEPVVEIFQQKGDSECMNGLWGVEAEPDPLCEFEKIREKGAPDCKDRPGFLGDVRLGCVSRLDYVRNVLLEGLKEEQRIGVNPYRLGIIADTDTHNSIPGHVREDRYVGHLANQDDTPQKRLEIEDNLVHNPGGLTAVWAEENTRNAIFTALKNREVYATSGPRIEVRFFGGWDFADALCDDPDFVRVGYQRGVPMGSVLPPKPVEANAPGFAVSARRDPDSPPGGGTPLQRIQIIKGWVESGQKLMTRVYEVPGSPDNGASVDPATCERSGQGFDTLCTVWTDPDFDPSEPAYYYARVVENPTCRWSTYECNRLKEAGQALPDICKEPDMKATVQERAWTSPIWYRPSPF